MRKFYMGKPFINAGDSVDIYIRGNKTVTDYSENESFQDDFLAIDETILEAERILFTDKAIDFDTYKKLRSFQDKSLSMQHVYGGYVKVTSRSFQNGQWTLTASCVDNMAWKLLSFL